MRHFLVGTGGKPLFDLLHKCGHILSTTFGRAEACVTRQLGLAKHMAEPLKQMLRWGGVGHPAAILGLARAARPTDMLSAAALAHHPLPAIPARRVLHDTEG